MTDRNTTQSEPITARGVIGRFVHLLSAQGVEGIFSILFFLYLAWQDATVYGEIMYAIAAGAVVMKVVLFGLYYPQVSEQGSADPTKAPEIVDRVNTIKLVLLFPAMAVILAGALYRGFSFQMAWTLFFVSLGFGLEAVAETYFADFRVRGRQDTEARIRIAASVSSYVYGFATAALGFGPLVMSMFKLVSALVRLSFGVASYLKTYTAPVFSVPARRAVWLMFKAASVFAFIEILGIVYNKTNIFFLERVTGVKGVAYYSATWNVVDPVSILASEQLLGWVIFPLLAKIWWSDREQAGPIVRRTAQWLMALAFPAMFFLYAGSDFIIGLVYPEEYKDAIWMQQYLVWTILLSFESNLFAYVMMVAGAARLLLLFAVIGTALNLIFNVTLVEPFGLAGGCLVIIFTKLVMTVLTFLYCQLRFRMFKSTDFLFPVVSAGACFGLYLLLDAVLIRWASMVIVSAVYFLTLRYVGMKVMGRIPSRSEAGSVES